MVTLRAQAVLTLGGGGVDFSVKVIVHQHHAVFSSPFQRDTSTVFAISYKKSIIIPKSCDILDNRSAPNFYNFEGTCILYLPLPMQPLFDPLPSISPPLSPSLPPIPTAAWGGNIKENGRIELPFMDDNRVMAACEGGISTEAVAQSPAARPSLPLATKQQENCVVFSVHF